MAALGEMVVGVPGGAVVGMTGGRVLLLDGATGVVEVSTLDVRPEQPAEMSTAITAASAS